MQLCRIIYYSLAALHVSSDIFACHQEHLLPSAVVAPVPWQRKVAETVWPVPDRVITVLCAPGDGWNHNLKHVEQFTEI